MIFRLNGAMTNDQTDVLKASAELQIQLANHGDIGSLYRWLCKEPEITATPADRPPKPGEQGGAWDFLIVLCGTEGAVRVALHALEAWIESKVTEVRIKVGDVEIVLRGRDPIALECIVEAARKMIDGS